MLRYLSSGESHGKALAAIIEGMVANLTVSEDEINEDLARRQGGIGRGARMKIEKDTVEVLSGIRGGRTIGSPITLVIRNSDSADRPEPITKLRPGHADLSGSVKYNQKDIRNILERASARESAIRVAAGSVAKQFLRNFGIEISSSVLSLGGSKDENEWAPLVSKASSDGDTLGGKFEVRVKGVPIGLGSHAHFDRKLDGLLAQAVMSIQAIKGVEIGLGFAVAELHGSMVHDEIAFEDNRFIHRTNNAGGIEGGISNGEDIVIKAAMKPIATLKKPLNSVDLIAKTPVQAHFERADVCAVHAASVIAEASVSFVIAQAFLEKFGGDSLEETTAHYRSFVI